MASRGTTDPHGRTTIYLAPISILTLLEEHGKLLESIYYTRQRTNTDESVVEGVFTIVTR